MVGRLGGIKRVGLLYGVFLLALYSCVHAQDPLTPVSPPADLRASGCQTQQFDVYFAQWSAELDSDARAVIASSQRALQGCEIDHVRIIGAAGAIGDEQSNQTLSSQRADAIAAALAAGGWPRARFELTPIGERGATTASGAAVPMRRAARVIVTAKAPAQVSR